MIRWPSYKIIVHGRKPVAYNVLHGSDGGSLMGRGVSYGVVRHRSYKLVIKLGGILCDPNVVAASGFVDNELEIVYSTRLCG